MDPARVCGKSRNRHLYKVMSQQILFYLYSRDFLETDLIDFAKVNPGIVVYVKPRRHRGPVMVAEYRQYFRYSYVSESIYNYLSLFAVNGDRQWVNCRNNTSEEIRKWIELLRGQNGDSSALRLRKMWHTDRPSIQGPWTPFTHRSPELNLVTFPQANLSRPLDVKQSATEKLIELFEQQKLQANSESLDKSRAE